MNKHKRLLVMSAIAIVFYGLVLCAIAYFSSSDLATNLIAGLLVLPLEVAGFAFLFQVLMEIRDEKRDYRIWRQVRLLILAELIQLYCDYHRLLFELHEFLAPEKGEQALRRFGGKTWLEFWKAEIGGYLGSAWDEWQWKYAKWRDITGLLSPGMSPELASIVAAFVHSTHTWNEVYVQLFAAAGLRLKELAGSEDASDYSLVRLLETDGYTHLSKKPLDLILEAARDLGIEVRCPEEGVFIFDGLRKRIDLTGDNAASSYGDLSKWLKDIRGTRP